MSQPIDETRLFEGHPIVDRVERKLRHFGGDLDRATARALLGMWKHGGELSVREVAAVLARFPVLEAAERTDWHPAPTMTRLAGGCPQHGPACHRVVLPGGVTEHRGGGPDGSLTATTGELGESLDEPTTELGRVPAPYGSDSERHLPASVRRFRADQREHYRRETGAGER